MMKCWGVVQQFINSRKEGMLVHVLIMATGLTSRGTLKQGSSGKLKKQTRDAANSLGVFSVEFADFPDNQMDTKPLLEIIVKR